MQKAIHFNGYIELPDGVEFGDIEELIGQRLALSGVQVKVKGDKTMNNETSGEATTLKRTLETVVISAKWNGKFLAALPEDPNQTTIDEAADEVASKRAGRGRTGKKDD